MNGSYCPQCGAPFQAGSRFCGECGASLDGVTIQCAECGAVYPAQAGACPECGCPAGAAATPAAVQSPPPVAPAAKRPGIGINVYNKLMLLLLLWPSWIYWSDIFILKIGDREALRFNFRGFSELFEWLSGLTRGDMRDTAEMLSVVQYVFIAAAVVAGLLYIIGWFRTDNGRPVWFWAIMGCYILPIALFTVGAHYLIVPVMGDDLAKLVARVAGEVTVWPTTHCVVAMVAPLVIGFVARPFFARKN